MMEERNRVQVKIYGQEFTISGEQPRDHIIKVADHVDRAMHELAKGLPSCPTSSLAVLAAVNCADEYYRSVDNVNELKAKTSSWKRMHSTMSSCGMKRKRTLYNTRRMHSPLSKTEKNCSVHTSRRSQNTGSCRSNSRSWSRQTKVCSVRMKP